MDSLHELDIFAGVSQAEYEWLLANSHSLHLAKGAYFIREGETATRFYVVLEGELQIERTFDGVPAIVGTTPRGIIGGEISLLLQTPSPMSAQAILPTQLMIFEEGAFRALVAQVPVVGARILQIATERIASTTSRRVQQEKMAALGKLSAGLAHELNNPAAAARRSASSLRALLPTLQRHSIDLCASGLGAHQLEMLLVFQQDLISQRAQVKPLSPLEQSDREDELTDWLDQVGCTGGYTMSPVFVAVGIVRDDLIALLQHFPHGSIIYVLNWLKTALDVADLLYEIDDGTRRISDLVGAVKEYTYMDQAPLQPVDIHRGLDNTLRVLNHKLKAIEVSREYDGALPHLLGRGGELNQVWTNLIDNAIDAMHGQGRLRLITRRENDYAMIEINDNGTGIPPEVQPRLFEPFFTTKPVGQGTGLGLDVSYRIIQQHQGSIEVQSRPGETRFIVRLPVGDGNLAST
jgi:signal transduction histidine kinase